MILYFLLSIFQLLQSCDFGVQMRKVGPNGFLLAINLLVSFAVITNETQFVYDLIVL